MKFIPVVCFLVIMSSCSKDNSSCIAKNSQGEEMYEVTGSDVCEDQISTEDGEYCDCSGK